MKVFITGCRGFIGGALAETLQKAGVFVDGTDLFECDLSDPFSDDLIERLDACDLIIHCAAIVGVDNHLKHTNSFIINHTIDLNIIEYCQETAKPLIYFSTSEVFGHNELITKESNFKISQHIRSNYALEKLMAERIIRESDFDHIILRPFNVVGPTQDPKKGVIPKFFEAARKNKTLTIYTDRHNNPARRGFLWIGDFCELIKRIVLNFNNFKNDSYNVGAPNDISIRELAHKIIELVGSKSEIKYQKPRKGDNIIFRRGLGDFEIWRKARISGILNVDGILKKFL